MNTAPQKPRKAQQPKPKAAAGNQRTRTSRRKKSGSGRGVLGFLKGCPAWVVWSGAILFSGLYIFLFYYFFVGPFSFRWKAIYGEMPFPEGYSVRGIDISHYQDQIRWEQLRNASMNNDPVSFVIIKATEGVSLMDDNFNENFYQAKNNGFIRGAYHFFNPEIDAARQARFFLHQVHLEPGDLPPVLDVEKKGNLSNAELQRAVMTWLDIVEQRYGRKPILYTGYRFRTDVLTDPVFDQYPFWIAHYYVEKLEYRGAWQIWQHTDCGRVDGIRGFVDCNIFNGTMQQLQEFTLQESDSEAADASEAPEEDSES